MEVLSICPIFEKKMSKQKLKLFYTFVLKFWTNGQKIGQTFLKTLICCGFEAVFRLSVFVHFVRFVHLLRFFAIFDNFSRTPLDK